MTHEELVRDFVKRLWAPTSMLAPAAVVVGLLVLGIISLRMLRRFPNFPRRPEMEWGARWVWLVSLSIIGVALAITHLALTRTPYMVSSSLLGKTVLDIGFLSLAMFRYQVSGVVAPLEALRLRLRRRPFDSDALNAWLARQDRWYSRRWRLRALESGTVAFVLLLDSYMVLGFTYPLDLSFDSTARALRTSDAVCEALRHDLRSGLVSQVSAYPPEETLPSYELRWGSARAISGSVRNLVRDVRGQRSTDPVLTGEYQLFIRVTKDTTATQAQDILARAQKLLAERHDPHSWRIAVYSRESKLSVHGVYQLTKGEQ